MELPDRYLGKGNGKSQQCAMKLSELGPRITLEIFKVEKGLSEGDILYHKFVQKTVAEAAAIKQKVAIYSLIIFFSSFLIHDFVLLRLKKNAYLNYKGERSKTKTLNVSVRLSKKS